jgi:hypothetical protein
MLSRGQYKALRETSLWRPLGIYVWNVCLCWPVFALALSGFVVLHTFSRRNGDGNKVFCHSQHGLFAPVSQRHQTDTAWPPNNCVQQTSTARRSVKHTIPQ